MLEIVFPPGLAPAVFGEGVDAAPGGDEKGVEEFLRASGAFGPGLADEEEDGEDDAVSDECGTHDEVRETLAEVVGVAESQGGDASEEHLHPTYYGHYFSDDSVG